MKWHPLFEYFNEGTGDRITVGQYDSGAWYWWANNRLDKEIGNSGEKDFATAEDAMADAQAWYEHEQSLAA